MAFFSAACFASCFAWFVAPSPSISCFKTAICFVLFFRSFNLNTETYIIIENTGERELKKLLHIRETAQKRVFSSRFRSQRGVEEDTKLLPRVKEYSSSSSERAQKPPNHRSREGVVVLVVHVCF